MSTLKQNFLKAGLVLAVFIGLNLVAKAGPLPLNTNPTGAYVINSTADLETLCQYVNDENGVASQGTPWTSQGKTFILMNDISGLTRSIGTMYNQFKGTFDGNGKKITLNITHYNVISIGIFGYTEGATIKNLTSTGSIWYDGISSYWIGLGAIVGIGHNTTITNCTNLTNITVSGYRLDDIGGIAGSLNSNSMVVSCSNAGKIEAPADGYNVGGIVGFLNNTNISYCVNIGKVSGIEEVGGIVGCGTTDNINNCINAGWVSGDIYVGGIIGSIIRLGTMQRCLNTGVIQGNTHVYSLIGCNYSNYSLSNKVTRCYYDNQMSPYVAIQGIANPSTVHGLSTNELAQVMLLQGPFRDWSIMPNCYSGGVWIMPLPQANQMYSYPTLYGSNSYISTLAAIPVRLANGNIWNNVSSIVTLDKGYWIQSTGYPAVGMFNWPTYGSIHWEGKQAYPSVYLSFPGMGATAEGSYVTHFHNRNGHSGSFELTVYMDDASGYRYKKTVPIITNGTPFKIPISDYDMYGFEASDVSPNIVTNNAVMDVSSAVEGYLTVAIFDMSGAKVMEVVDKSVTAQSQTQVELNNLNNLSAGNYMVAVSVGNNVVFRRFVKQ